MWPNRGASFFMGGNSHSLMTAEKALAVAQPELALDLVESAAAQLASEGIYTGERLFRDDPVKYEAIVRALAENWSKESIRKAFGVAWETVDAVAKREGSSIREQKEEIRDTISTVIRLGLHSLKKKAEDGKLSVLDFGILIDKFQVLNGEASSIVGHQHAATVDDVTAYIAGLEQARAREVQDTGSQERENAQSGGPVIEVLALPCSPSDLGPSGVETPIHEPIPLLNP